MSDLIDRQAILDKFKALCDACGEGEKYNWVMCRACALDDAIAFVEDIPSAEPERKKGKWIPVTEALPEDNRQVLVYAQSTHFALAKYDEMREADGKYRKQWVTFDAWKPYYTVENVIAWMPLPEPAKIGDGK